jgi:uncharacterized protein YqhQ
MDNSQHSAVANLSQRVDNSIERAVIRVDIFVIYFRSLSCHKRIKRILITDNGAYQDTNVYE